MHGQAERALLAGAKRRNRLRCLSTRFRCDVELTMTCQLRRLRGRATSGGAATTGGADDAAMSSASCPSTGASKIKRTGSSIPSSTERRHMTFIATIE